MGKIDLIGDVFADRKSRDLGNSKRLDDHIAEIKALPCSRRKRPSKARGPTLLSIYITAQPSLVIRKCLLMLALRRAEFADQDVSRDHRQR